MIRILVVDDDLEIIRSLGNTFTTMLRGYRLLTATTANQGLNIIKEERPEIIIMDVRLGPLSGMDLLEEYPKHAKDYRPRIIVITAYRDEKAEKRAEELKVDAFLRKPLVRQDLVRAVLRSIINYHDSERRNAEFALKALERTLGKTEQANQELDEKLKPEDPSKEKENPPEIS